MAKLPVPLVCVCGYATMDSGDAVKHIKETHPEMWEPLPEDREES